MRDFESLFPQECYRPVFIISEPQNDLFDEATRNELQELREKVRIKELPASSPALLQLVTHSQRQVCNMASCFDYSRCRGELTIYVYPDHEGLQQSMFFKSMLEYFRNSPYYTNDPEQACLFIPSIDTSDRDPLGHDYVPDVEKHLHGLPYWNNGRNHLIFNTFPGTYPHYYEHLDFDTHQAILVKSCITLRTFRQNFDVSFPHYKPDSDLPRMTITQPGSPRQYLATFKGKRYLYGTGKAVREDLRAVDNNSTILVLTTCIHLKTWERFADAECSRDNSRYEHFDYQSLLNQSVFSFVPRGRRINTFRFLEVIAAGSIPVNLGDDLIFPFNEVMQWEGAIVNVPENMVGSIDAVLSSFSQQDVLVMQTRLKYMWETHLSSFNSALRCVAETLRQRIFPQARKSQEYWNGPLPQVKLRTFVPKDLPVATNFDEEVRTVIEPRQTFGEYTVMILVHDRFDVMFDMIRSSLAYTTRMDKLIVIMNDPVNEPMSTDWPSIYCPIEVYRIPRNTLNNRFLPLPSINTEAVMAIDDDVYLDAVEIEFGYQTWLENSDRLVGWPARKHVRENGKWVYNSALGSTYSMILTGAAFYHRRYNELYSFSLPSKIFDFVSEKLNCEDIAMNYMVANLTRKPPIKVTGRWTFPCNRCVDRKLSTHTNGGLVAHLEARSQCMQLFAEVFGYQPLIESYARADPVVYDGKAAIGLSEANIFAIPYPP